MIAKEIIEIWQAVNPRLPLHSEYYVLKLIDKVCFKKVKAINRKSLSTKLTKNLEEKLDNCLIFSWALARYKCIPVMTMQSSVMQKIVKDSI